MPIFLYVAVVSDNDGSAFITKAEFDSLKNNFQAQIDNYNQSIDSKIDGAIASYLAGIKVITDEAPEYRYYGAVENRDAKPWITMRLIEFADSYTWGDGNTTITDPNNARTWFTTSTRNDRGYGPGVWLYAIRDTSNSWYVLDGTYGAIQGSKITSADNGWTNYGFNAAGTAPQFTAVKNPGEIKISDTTKRTYLMSMALSDAYGARVPLWNPSFRVYELLDSGEFTFQFYCVQDGYEDDAHLKFKGRNISSPTSGGLAYMHDGSKLVHYKSDGTSTIIQQGKNCTSGTIYTFTLDVRSGDRIELQCQSGYSCYSLTYCNIRVSANIPGWKVEGT